MDQTKPVDEHQTKRPNLSIPITPDIYTINHSDENLAPSTHITPKRCTQSFAKRIKTFDKQKKNGPARLHIRARGHHVCFNPNSPDSKICGLWKPTLSLAGVIVCVYVYVCVWEWFVQQQQHTHTYTKVAPNPNTVRVGIMTTYDDRKPTFRRQRMVDNNILGSRLTLMPAAPNILSAQHNPSPSPPLHSPSLPTQRSSCQRDGIYRPTTTGRINVNK